MKNSTLYFATAVVGLLALGATAAHAQTTSLYDGTQGTTPGAQGWLFTAIPSAGATQTYDAAGQFTTLSTLGTGTAGSNVTYAGYGRTDTLLSDNGFTLNFTLRVNSESHANVNRAGVNLIALNEAKRGVELGFWTDTIQVQNLDGNNFVFDSSERASFATTSLVAYSLTFTSTGYTLTSGGTTLMSGSLRDYTPYTGSIDPYETPNFLFLGDDTTSARGSLSLQSVTLTQAVAAPEPATLALVLPGMALLALRRRRPGQAR